MAWLKVTIANLKIFFKQYGRQILLALLLIGMILVVGYHCPFYTVTHIRCPGCGMTRALLALLAGNWRLSLAWHPMLIPTVVLGLGAAYFFKKNPRLAMALVWIWVILMIGCWIYRLIYVFPYDYLWLS